MDLGQNRKRIPEIDLYILLKWRFIAIFVVNKLSSGHENYLEHKKLVDFAPHADFPPNLALPDPEKTQSLKYRK